MDTKRYAVVTNAFRMVFFILGCSSVGAKEGPGRGAYVPPPSLAGYSTESIIASGQRGGDLTPTGSNTTEAFNREMGMAMEIWNEHRWDEALPMFQSIYRNHPESPWAAEAELHEACYLKYNSRYDEAEERFLSVFKKHSKERIRKRVLYYLPHLYAQTGRAKAAQECLLLLNEFELNWQERQFLENYARIYHIAVLEDEASRQCGLQSVSLALEALERVAPGDSLRNVTMADIYRGRMGDKVVRENPLGYSLQELAEESGGQLRIVSYEELKTAAHPHCPVIAYLEAPSAPRFYSALGRKSSNAAHPYTGHYLVVEKATDTYVDVLDPQGGRTRWAKGDFLYRWEGSVLVLSADHRMLGTALPRDEASAKRGGCCGSVPPDPEGGKCQNNRGLNMRNGPAGVSLNGPGAGSGGIAGGVGGNCPGCGRGSPSYSFGLGSVNLNLSDMPIWYPPAKGPSLDLSLTYNRVNSQNLATNYLANYFSFGNKWSFNFGAYVKGAPDNRVQVILEDGQMLQYDSALQPMDLQNRDILFVTNGMYVLRFDGSETEYRFSTNTSVANGQKLESIRDRFGNELRLNYDATGRLTNSVDAIGRTLDFSCDANGWVTEVRDCLGRTAEFEYDGIGNLVSMTDMGGYSTLVEYDVNSWVTNMVYPSGLDVSFNYTSGIDLGYPYNKSEYAAAGYPSFRIVASNVLGHDEELFYHAFEVMGPITLRDAARNIWLYANRSPGVATQAQRSSFGIYYEGIYSWYWENKLRGVQWTYRSFNVAGDIDCLSMPAVPLQEYIGAGPVTGELYQGSFWKEFEYDAHHWLVKETWWTNPPPPSEFYNYQPHGIWSNRYDVKGNLVWRQDPYSNVVAYGYDTLGNRIWESNAMRYVTRMEYNEYGDLTNLVDTVGTTTRFEYCENGWNTAVEFPDGTRQTMGYDGIGRLSAGTNAAGFWSRYQYDDMDRITRIDYPDDSFETREYGCCGMERMTDRLGRETRYSHDLMQRVVAVTNAAGHGVEFDYDPLGNVTNLHVRVNGTRRTTQFKYASSNGYSRLVRRVSPLGKTNSYTYMYRGGLNTRTDGKGQVVSNNYDALGRLSLISYGRRTNVTFVYDKLDHLVKTTEPYGTNMMRYDAIGRMTNRLAAYRVPGFTPVRYEFRYEYDPAGNVMGRTLIGQAGFTNVIRDDFRYDSMHRMIDASNQWATASYSYDLGRLSRKQYGNGDTADWAYNLESQPTSLTISNNGLLQGWYYERNKMGSITGITDSEGNRFEYTYDAIDQLIRETRNGTNITAWSYDEAGNRLTMTEPSGAKSYVCNADNELVGIAEGPDACITVTGAVEPGPNSNKWYDTWAEARGVSAPVTPTNGAFSIPGVPVSEGINRLTVEVRDVSGNTATQTVEFTKGTLDPSERLEYDLNGNMTNWIQAGVTNAFSYDPENRLAKVESNGTTVLECWYDYAGRRIAKKETIGSVTNAVQYVYDGWTIVAVLNGQGQLLEYYTRGAGIAGDIGTIVAETKFTNGHSMSTCYYHHNHRGDITLVRSGASTLASYEYAPFGESRSITGSFDARFRFSSKEADEKAKCYYYGYRYLSPCNGRFITIDPIEENGGLNLYLFVNSNPINSFDELGLEAQGDKCEKEGEEKHISWWLYKPYCFQMWPEKKQKKLVGCKAKCKKTLFYRGPFWICITPITDITNWKDD